MSHYDYYCLTDREFYELQKGFLRRRDLQLWDLRLLAYPMWHQNAEKPPKITEWMPIKSLDKKETIIEKRWTPEEIKKVFGQYHEA